MGVIFPLSIPGKIVLTLIAISLGIIWSMLQFPSFWKKRFREGSDSKLLKKFERLDALKKTKKIQKQNKG